MFFKPKSFIGVDIGAGGIKVVELRKEKNRPVLFTYAFSTDEQDVHHLTPQQMMFKRLPAAQAGGRLHTEPLMENQKKEIADNSPELDEKKIQAYADKIKTVYSAAKAVAKAACISLPVSAVFHSIVTLPQEKNKEVLNKMLKAEVKKFVSVPLEDLALDYQPIEIKTEQKSQRILINAVPVSIINFYTKIFQLAGLQLEALEPESTAVSRCLVGRDKAVTMLIDIGAERTNLFIIDQSVPITHHSIETGGNKANKILENIWGAGEESAWQMKYDVFEYLAGKQEILGQDGFINMFMPIIDPIIKAIDVSLALYLRQEGNENKKPEKIILTGGMAMMPFLCSYIADKFKLKCYVGDPWSRVVYQDSLKPLLAKIGPRMSVAIGLALRNMV